MQKIKFFGSRTAVVVALCAALAGCAQYEVRRAFFGMSKDDLATATNKYSQTFEKDASVVWDETVKILTDDFSARIYSQDKKQWFIVAYRFDKAYPNVIDTTDVGILLASPQAGKTEVTVFSDNSRLAGWVSEELFSVLAGGEPKQPVNPVIPQKEYRPTKKLKL
ncbi:MAG: hypothetical protein PHS37_03615 [Candidatus Omnitrophica bacterium]|nr:hypothetical protein [Candidatus Omnitrophota bacterium]